MKNITIIPTFLFAFAMLFLFLGSCQNENDSEPDLHPIMMFSDRDGLWGADEQGNKKLIARVGDYYFGYYINDIEVLNELIYVHSDYVISVFDIMGNLVKDIDISRDVSYPLKFCVLPDASFAFLDNKNDKVSFTTASGEFIRDVEMGDVSQEYLQNINGVVVDNSLIVANIGDSTVMEINLNTYQSSILSIKADGDLDYHEGVFYCCQGNVVHKAILDVVEFDKLCQLSGYNATGIAVDNHGHYAYVTTNFSDNIYKVDLKNGTYTVFITDLNYPEDIEWIK